MNIPTDIRDYVNRHFEAPDVPRVLTALEHAKLHDGRVPPARMLRCALVAADGEVDRLEHYVSELAIDFRDVIVAGEYQDRNGELTQIRDLSLPFADS